MKISTHKIKHLVRESVKRKLKEQEAQLNTADKEAERESSSIGKKASNMQIIWQKIKKTHFRH